MAIHSVSLRFGLIKESGYSLPELMVSLLISTLLLMAVTQFTLSGQRAGKLVSDKNELVQSVSDVLRYIADSALRAGYNEESDIPTVLTGAAGVWHVSEHRLSYTYYRQDHYSSHYFWADLTDSKLKYCTTHSAVFPTVSSCPVYFSLLDDSRIRVIDFKVEHIFIGNQALLQIQLEAQLANGLADSHQIITLAARN